MCNRSNSQSLVTNCIFWDGSGGEVYNNDDESTPIISSCVVSGDDVGEGTISSDIISADPLLGPLADNGGPTKTHALTFGSPAIDKGATIPTISCDQRGVARPQGSAFDIGAYESWEKQILTVNTIGNGSVTRDPSGDIVGTTGKCWSYDKDAPVALTAVDGSRDWFVTWSGDASGTDPTASVTMSCDHAVEAVFDPVWIITVSAGPGGDITASGDVAGATEVKVRNGADKTFTVTPDAGYSIGPVRVDGGIILLGAGSKYTFTNVTEDHTLEATFIANPTPTLTPIPSVTPTLTPIPSATPTPIPTAAPTTNPTSAPTATPTVTPTPVPTPDPRIPLPTVTLTITLYAGGTIVSGPIDISVTPTLTPSVTPTPIPTAAPTTNPTSAPTATPTVTPTPLPTPDPRIPLPTVKLTITLYAGGTIVAGPFDITDPTTLSALLSSQTLLAQLLATDPSAILSGTYNMDLIRFFSLVADLDPGILDFTILFEVTVEGVPAGYRAQVFVLTRTFDSKGNPTGYSVVPRDEGANVFRKKSGARGWTETWRVTIRDGGVTDGDARRDGSVAPQIAAVVAVFPMATPTVTMTPTLGDRGSGGGCAIPANGSAVLAALLLLSPVVLMRRR